MSTEEKAIDEADIGQDRDLLPSMGEHHRGRTIIRTTTIAMLKMKRWRNISTTARRDLARALTAMILLKSDSVSMLSRSTLQVEKMLSFRALKNLEKNGVIIRETSISREENCKMSKSARKKRQRGLLVTKIEERPLGEVTLASGGLLHHQGVGETMEAVVAPTNIGEMMQGLQEIMEVEIPMEEVRATVEERAADIEALLISFN
jgi:NADH dehydrogenase/NADH:ubiquinone oxidoreductase subunit G